MPILVENVLCRCCVCDLKWVSEGFVADEDLFELELPSEQIYLDVNFWLTEASYWIRILHTQIDSPTFKLKKSLPNDHHFFPHPKVTFPLSFHVLFRTHDPFLSRSPTAIMVPLLISEPFVSC
ncbi:hypothetical protein VNO78_30755 [Psophocarpus tetragonolobus]|uniref:Uncharacterized protein n=1 Tax=Psophocarpus tetragonolobus TaxID=3891 RepID=A0AAN9X5K4_PSOTE